MLYLHDNIVKETTYTVHLRIVLLEYNHALRCMFTENINIQGVRAYYYFYRFHFWYPYALIGEYDINKWTINQMYCLICHWTLFF